MGVKFDKFDQLIDTIIWTFQNDLKVSSIKSHTVIHRSQCDEYFTSMILFKSGHNTVSVNSKAAHSSIMRNIAYDLLGDCSSLTSSSRRKKLEDLVIRAKKEFAIAQTESISSRMIIIKEFQTAKLWNLENESTKQFVKIARNVLEGYNRQLKTNQLLKHIPEELESIFFTVLSDNYSEKDTVRLWRLYRIKNVIQS